MTAEEKKRLIERNTRLNWKHILRAAPIPAIGIPAVLLSEHYLGPVGQGLVGVALLASLLTYIHFLPKLPDQ